MRRLDLGEKQEARLIRCYLDGAEMSLIQQRFGLNNNQMHRILKRHGVTTSRTPHEAARSASQ